MIALRLVAKNPGAAIRKIFSAIKNKLENDETIGAGLAAALLFTKIIFTRSAARTVKF